MKPINARLGYLLGACLLLTAALFAPSAAAAAPDLSITKTHVGAFTQGQVGATYTITVSNAAAAGPTDGSTVTVTDTVPAGLTPTSISGTGWACTQPSGPCTRSDVLNAGSSYPVLTLMVNVSNAGGLVDVTNSASVTGGGDTPPGVDDSVRDSTIINCTSGCGTVTVTETDVTSFGPTNAIFFTVTQYIGPQTILAGNVEFCAVAPVFTGCTVQSGSGTPDDPFSMGGCTLVSRPSGCTGTGGALFSIVPGGTNSIR